MEKTPPVQDPRKPDELSNLTARTRKPSYIFNKLRRGSRKPKFNWKWKRTKP